MKLEEAIVYLLASSGNTANSSTKSAKIVDELRQNGNSSTKSAKIVDKPRQAGSYGMSLISALQPSSGRREWLARRNI